MNNYSMTRVLAATAAFGLGMAGAAPLAADQLTMATSWGGGPHLEVLANGYAKNVAFLTNGEITFEVFPAGTLGSPLKVVETVKTGVADSGHHWSGYDWGVDKTAVLFGGYAGSMPAEHYIHWLYEGGGVDLWKQWRLEEHGIVAFPCGSHADEIFMQSNRRVETLDDFQGLKVRTSGAWAEIATELGASTVILPGPEVYPALERGVVDAMEWATPWINYEMGFHKVAQYVILPGVHQASSAQECVFSETTWEGFSDREKELLELAGKLTTLDAWLTFNNGDVDALGKLEEAGNEIVVVDDAFIEAAREKTRAWEDRTVAEQGGWFERVLTSQRDFMKRWEAAPLYRSELK
jgi:TRAP-type mannitol/chloroaromatic compound transport system substrate-binding protein